MATNNEPGAAVLAIFDQLINRVKQARPVRSDGKPLGGGMVYSRMVLGMPVDPEDYIRPWSPMGGSTLQDMASKAQLPSVAAVAGSPSAAAPSGPAAPPAPDPKFARSMQAAYKTAQLANVLLQVTTDESYMEYPVGRHLDFSYEGIISSMQPMPMPPINPEVQKQIDDATKLLYELDTDGSILGKSKVHATYRKNAQALALAKAIYATEQAAAKANQAKADLWPMTSATYQQAVDDAWDALKSEGAEKVERSLDIIGSVGVCVQDHMIKKARQLFDAYNLGLAGVPAPIPYSYISPTSWCDPDDDQSGWQKITVTSSEYQHFDASSSTMGGQHSSQQDASATGGSGGVMLGFAAFGATHSEQQQSSQWQGSSQYQFTSAFKNTAKNLNISLEYALCTIIRPWLVSDLFYLQNWYLVGAKKNAISDGTIAGQVQTDKPLLPMIPQQMLVIRNVTISTTEWGEDSEALTSYFGQSSGDQSSSSSHTAGSGGVCLGFVSFGGSASHEESHAQEKGQWGQARSGSSHFGTTFNGETLSIRGAQIVAFLCDILPSCPPLDDPGLSKKKTADKAAAAQPVAAAAQPVAAPAQPVAAPAQPVAAPAQPVAAPAQPVAAPAQPVA
jgi:hypothetical protein